MQFLGEISDHSLGLSLTPPLSHTFSLRKSARAILLNEKNDMALMRLNTYGTHKLPGGGVEVGETIELALVREIKEEVGATFVNPKALSVVVEFRSKHQLVHLSTAFSCTLSGTLVASTFEEKEIEEGCEIIWVSPEKALQYICADIPKRYSHHFIQAREIAILEEFLRR